MTQAEELNGRVCAALSAHVTVQPAEDQAVIDQRALTQLSEFQRFMRLRVEGGLSDRSGQQILDQQVAQMQATLAAEQRTAVVAAKELASLYGAGV